MTRGPRPMGSRCFRMIQYPEDRFARHSDPAGGEIQLILTDHLLLTLRAGAFG